MILFSECMGRTALIIHIAVCAVVGLTTSWLFEVFWLAAAFWCSGVMYLTGSLAFVEDSLPGGFDNPDGQSPPLGAWFAVKSAAVSLALVLVGTGFQLRFGLE